MRISRYLISLFGLCLISVPFCEQTSYAQTHLKTQTESQTEAQTDWGTEWGSIKSDGDAGLVLLTVDDPTKEIRLPPGLFQRVSIIRARLGTTQWPGKTLEFSFNQDATESKLRLPPQVSDGPLSITLETAESSHQFPDGRIVLSALDCTVVGDSAKLESHPGNHRIGFWSNADDLVRWQYKATRPGMYKVFLTYSVAITSGEQASEVEISFDHGTSHQSHVQTLVGTGSWYQYATLELGKLYIDSPGEHTIEVKCLKKQGGAVMNLKAVTLIPTCEGEPPVQAADGSIQLLANDATLRSQLLQWEPKLTKRTLGYWANAEDYAYWDFEVTEAATFGVEIFQGCGKDQGSSKVEFAFFKFGNDQPVANLSHTVLDTGHWQNFKPFEIGQTTLEIGRYRLRVNAKEKAKNAVMDLRQVQLKPLK